MVSTPLFFVEEHPVGILLLPGPKISIEVNRRAE
jgi:hypothetical protein